MARMTILIVILLTALFNFSCDTTEPLTNGGNNVDTTSHEFNWAIDTIGGLSSNLNDVWGIDENNVYAVGLVILSLSPFNVANIMHWDGAEWRKIEYLEGTLFSIYGFEKNDIWVCGYWRVDDNAYALISHWDGVEWRTWKFNEFPGLNSIWGTSSQNMYAVGTEGTILHYNGNAWQKMSSGITEELREIWGINDREIYAVGNSRTTFNGIILKFNGQQWIKINDHTFRPDKPSGELLSVWGGSSNRFYVDRFMGHDTTWALVDWPRDNTLIDDIFGSAENNIFAVGSFDLIMHYNGNTFHRYHFYKKPSGGRLKGIFATQSHVFIVGSSQEFKGVVYRGF